MTTIGSAYQSRLTSLGLLVACVALTLPARAELQGGALDVRGAYPLVLNSGPGDSRYQGSFVSDVRVLLFGETFGGGFGLEHYWLKNRVPANGAIGSKVSSSATVFPLHFVVMALSGHKNSLIGNLFFDFSLGLGWRTIGGVSGSMITRTAGAELDWFFHPVKDSPFFVGPTAALGFISEGRQSHIGALDLLNLGLRVGISSRD